MIAACRSGHLEFSPIFIPHPGAVFAGRWRERGWFYFKFSHGLKHKVKGKDGNKKNRSMLEPERILNNICFKLLSDLQNKLKLRGGLPR